jgi:hypothetical protein
MNKKYNGWTNYETWCVNLWLNNDQGSYRYWIEAAETTLQNEAPSSPRVEVYGYTVRNAARCLLAEKLKDELHGTELLERSCVYADLLQAALAAVNWQEIAEGFLPEEAAAPQTPIPPPSDDLNGTLFEPGRLIITRAAVTDIPQEDIDAAFARHLRGDWGLLVPQDCDTNQEALKEGGGLFSVYQSTSGKRFWIVTEPDRSTTTVLLPADY